MQVMDYVDLKSLIRVVTTCLVLMNNDVDAVHGRRCLADGFFTRTICEKRRHAKGLTYRIFKNELAGC